MWGIKRSLLLVFILLTFVGKTQVDAGFVRFLSENQLMQEHWAYLQSVSSSADSLAMLKAKFHFQYGNDSLFLEEFSRSVVLFLDDEPAFELMCAAMLKNLTPYREKWFDLVLPALLDGDTNPFIRVYLTGCDPLKENQFFVDESLRSDYLRFVKASGKKAWLAASMSAVIPGLGELYIGNFRSFVNKLGAGTVFGVQFAESVALLGLLRPLPVLNLGFYSAFYLANIVGSYRDTKSKKIALKNQYFINASEFYSADQHNSLY